MKLTGRIINRGTASAEAVVMDVTFSFIGGFDPQTGRLILEGHPLHGTSVAGKVLVCPGGKGGTIAPFIAYQAKQAGVAPAAILCDWIDPILTECALVIDIPMLETFDQSAVTNIETGQHVIINEGSIEVI